MNKVYLLIGGNMGNRLQNLHQATDLLNKRPGTVVQCSGIYETAAWGKTDQQAFLNQALLLHTPLDAATLMQELLQIELDMGRKRLEKNGPRLIDIDILFFNNAIIREPDLIIPHPAIQYRRFALAPMAAIAPDLVHPVLQKTISALLKECPDTLAVTKINSDS